MQQAAHLPGSASHCTKLYACLLPPPLLQGGCQVPAELCARGLRRYRRLRGQVRDGGARHHHCAAERRHLWVAAPRPAAGVCGGVAASCVDDSNLVALCTCDTPLQLGLDRRLRVLPFSVRNWSEPDAVRVSGEGGGRHRGCPKCALPPELCVATCHACPSAEEQQSAGRCDGGEGLACRRYPAAAASIAT